MQTRLLLALIALMTFMSIARADDSFQMCHPVASLPFSKLLNAKVPEYPANYETSAHLHQDGEWFFDLPVNEVWKLYTQTPMSNAWASRYIVNRFTLAPGSSTPVDKAIDWPSSRRRDWPQWDEMQSYAPENWPGLNIGTRIYLDIKADLIGVFCDMAIGFEVTKMVENQVIELEYLDFSPPYGKQWIYFESVSANKTRVHQVSQYLGKNFFIDRGYSFFHNEEIPRLHQQMQNLARMRAQ